MAAPKWLRLSNPCTQSDSYRLSNIAGNRQIIPYSSTYSLKTRLLLRERYHEIANAAQKAKCNAAATSVALLKSVSDSVCNAIKEPGIDTKSVPGSYYVPGVPQERLSRIQKKKSRQNGSLRVLATIFI